MGFFVSNLKYSSKYRTVMFKKYLKHFAVFVETFIFGSSKEHLFDIEIFL